MVEIELVEQQAQPSLAIRTRCSVEELPQTIGTSYAKIMAYMAELAIEPAGAPYCAYYNMDMQNLDVEMGFPVSQSQPSQGDVECVIIPAGKVIACMHKGSYESMSAPYEAMAAWIEKSEYKATGTVYEYYFTNPDVPADEHLTRIVMSLK